MYNFTAGPIKMEDSLTNCKQPVPHRSKLFENLYRKIKNNISLLLNSNKEHSCVIIPGSGTLGVECLISNYVIHKKGLFISNGSFGNKWINIGKIYNKNINTYIKPINQNLNYKEIEEIIKKENIETILFVYHETSCCILNNIIKLNKICKKYNVDMVVDAVSAIGVIYINLQNLSQISFITFSSNKGLLSYPGISFIVGKNKKFKECKNYEKKSFYLDINNYIEYSKINQTPTTPAVNVIETTNRSIESIIQTPNYSKYKELNKYIIDEMKKIGISHIDVKDKFYFCTNFWYPKIINENEFFSYLESKNIFLYKCKGELMGKAFQISNIGNINKKDVDFVINTIYSFFKTDY